MPRSLDRTLAGQKPRETSRYTYPQALLTNTLRRVRPWDLIRPAFGPGGAPPPRRQLEAKSLPVPQHQHLDAAIQQAPGPFSGTSPKSLSDHTSDRAHMPGRVPQLACNTRGRFGKRRDRYGNLLHLLAADGGRSCVGFCSLGDRDFRDLLRLLWNGPQSTVRVLVQMTPPEQLRASPRVRRGDREGLGQWLHPRSLQAFASRAACWQEGKWFHKRD